MARIVTLSIGNLKLEAELNATSTAEIIWDTLPFRSHGSVWGEELYFKIPEELDLELEKGQDVVEIGDPGYWPMGNPFCIFYVPTPASIDERPRPLSPVTVFGKVLGGVTHLSSMTTGAKVFVERNE